MSRRHKRSRQRNTAAKAAAAQTAKPALQRISVPTRLPKLCGGQVVRAGTTDALLNHRPVAAILSCAGSTVHPFPETYPQC